MNPPCNTGGLQLVLGSKFFSNTEHVLTPFCILTIHHKAVKIGTWRRHYTNTPKTGSSSIPVKKGQHQTLRKSRVSNSKCRHEFVTKATLTVRGKKSESNFTRREYLKEKQRMDGFWKVKLWQRVINPEHKLRLKRFLNQSSVILDTLPPSCG